jgi:hypothetical protein
MSDGSVVSTYQLPEKGDLEKTGQQAGQAGGAGGPCREDGRRHAGTLSWLAGGMSNPFADLLLFVQLSEM